MGLHFNHSAQLLALLNTRNVIQLCQEIAELYKVSHLDKAHLARLESTSDIELDLLEEMRSSAQASLKEFKEKLDLYFLWIQIHKENGAECIPGL